jgi:hypothetical protein
MIALLLMACSDYSVYSPPPVPVADPPGTDPDAFFGKPPDWDSCTAAWSGYYYNLPADHPDLRPVEEESPDPDVVDWWDPGYLAFRRDDPSLEFGASWWPVDQGFEEDPEWFSGRWAAWIRVRDGGSVTVVVGAVSDLWVGVDREWVLGRSGAEELEGEEVEVQLPAGQFPIELRYAQRTDAGSGLRFRIADPEVQLCYPDFSQ